MIKNITRARSFLCLLTTNVRQEGSAICLHVRYHRGQWHMFTRMSPLWPAVTKLFPKGRAPLKNRNKTHKCEPPTFSLSAHSLRLAVGEQPQQLPQNTKGFAAHPNTPSRYWTAKKEKRATLLEDIPAEILDLPNTPRMVNVCSSQNISLVSWTQLHIIRSFWQDKKKFWVQRSAKVTEKCSRYFLL